MIEPRTYGINKNPIKKITNPQSIKANEIPNIKDANPVSVICATTTSADTNAMANLSWCLIFFFFVGLVAVVVVVVMVVGWWLWWWFGLFCLFVSLVMIVGYG